MCSLGLVQVEVKEEACPPRQAKPGICWHSWAVVPHVKAGVQPEIPLTRNMLVRMILHTSEGGSQMQ